MLAAPQPSRASSSSSGSPFSNVRESLVWLYAAIVVYVGFRLAILHTNFDAVAMPSFELGTIGNLAMVVPEGRGGAAITDHFDNVGGHLVVGLLAAPLYALFGPSYWTLKLVPLLLGVGTLLLVWRLLSRHFDRRAAILAVFLFAIAPPVLLKYSLIAKGNHFENLFFQLWFLNAFFDMHARGVTKRGLFWTGLSAGCAVFVYTGALMTVVSALFVHVVARGWKKSFADAPSALATFSLGVLPLLWLDLASGGREREFLRMRFLEHHVPSLADLVSRWLAFWTEIVPKSACFEDFAGIPASWGGAFFLAVFAVAWFVVARSAWRGMRSFVPTTGERSTGVERARFEHAKTAIWLVHLPMISFLAATFDFQFKPYAAPVEVGQYRYLVPHVAWAILLIAIASSRLWSDVSNGLRVFGRLLAGAAFATGLFALPLVRFDGATSNFGTRYVGFWFEYYPNVLFRDRPWVVADMEADVANFESRNASRVCQGLGFSLAWAAELRGRSDESSMDRIREIVSRFELDHTINVARGIGSHMRRGSADGAAGVERLRESLNSLGDSTDPLTPYVVEGLALDPNFPLVVSARSFLERGAALEPLVPRRLVGCLYRGLGIACGRELPRDLPIDRSLAAEFASATPTELRDEFYFGLGWGAAETTNSGDRIESLRRAVAGEHRAAAWVGFGAALRHNHDVDDLSRGAWTQQELAWIAFGTAWLDYPRSFPIGAWR